MTTKVSAYRREQQISSVRLAATSNVSGTYFNGSLNNGVGATLTVAASSLTLDSVACAANDRVILPFQTTASQNGIYDVTSIGSTVVLTRSYDFQTFDQMKTGYYIPVQNGDLYRGNMFAVVAPQVNVVGTDSILLQATYSGAILKSFDVTVGQASLASAGSVTLITSSGTQQYRIRTMQLNSGGTNFSGGGGDRLGQVTDGTTVYSVIPAATMQSLVNAGWGITTTLPFPASAAIFTPTVAGTNLVFKYSGGATDYTAGSLRISGLVELIA